MEANENGKSIISILPRGNNVILKATTKISILVVIGSEPKKTDVDVVEREVVAIGPDVKNLNIGDKVIVTSHASAVLDVKENKNSQTSLSEIYKDTIKNNKEWQELVKSTPKIDLVEYLLYSEYQVVAIIK